MNFISIDANKAFFAYGSWRGLPFLCNGRVSGYRKCPQAFLKKAYLPSDEVQYLKINSTESIVLENAVGDHKSFRPPNALVYAPHYPCSPLICSTQEFCSALSFASVQLILRSEKCG